MRGGGAHARDQSGKFPNEHFQSQFWRATPSLHNGSRVPIHFVGRLEHWHEDLTEFLDMVVAKDPAHYAQGEQRMKLERIKRHIFDGHSNHHALSGTIDTELIERSPSLQKRSARSRHRIPTAGQGWHVGVN